MAIPQGVEIDNGNVGGTRYLRVQGFCAMLACRRTATHRNRIGYLSVLSPSSDHARNQAFRQGLRELGYIDGQNIRIEARYAEGDLKRLPKLASELASLKPDVVVAGGSTAIGAMKKATSTIPIGMAHGSDPVELGYVASLARPGGNITGLTHLAPELGGKRLEFLKAIVQNSRRWRFSLILALAAIAHR
jgi:putative tryptophan/tyrosine transport system substrate-binding protein